METNLVKRCLDQGGILKPLLIPADETNGTGLMNPSIYVDKGNIKGIIRHVNYTFYHSEKKLFQHPYGPLTYIHPETDIHLRTWNWYYELNSDLEITKLTKVDTSRFDTYEPLWDFVGLEDARLFKWEDRYYISGVRRDTTTNGQGRMELSELSFLADGRVEEISRLRIDPPNDPNSYCEKNWMPILDMPFHYVKWSNPTEVVEINKVSTSSRTVNLVNQDISLYRDLRGGSQVLSYPDHHIAITHEVDLFKSETGRKDAVYYHRVVIWDKDWKIKHVSKEFHFMDGLVEFCIGMADYGNTFLITFGFQDNAAFVLSAPKEVLYNYVYENCFLIEK